MQYRYLKTRGALNEAGARPGVAPAGPGEPAAWRGGTIPPEVIALLPESIARQHLVIPVAAEGETVTVAAVDSHDMALADKLSFLIARKVRLVPAPRDTILALINQAYKRRGADALDSGVYETEADDDDDVDVTPARVFGAHGEPAALGHRAIQGAGPRRAKGPSPARATPQAPGLDPSHPMGGSGVLTYVVEEGQRVLMRRLNGSMAVIVGPRRVWRGWRVFRPMLHHVAHPGDYLTVRYRDGRQEHLPGPAEVWFDPRFHHEVTREEGLQIAAKEAVVVYSTKEGSDAVQRRIVHGPALFVPRPGEWLHTFSWHASQGGSHGVVKVPKGLVFQKLWLMPDQMYHDVTDVRTADDAVLTIRLMLFFELLDIERMLETTHDPIGDFVNAASSDVVDFTGRHDFESFKHNTDQLNELTTYRQLVGRAAQCGYRINKVVYRGYGAPERLQQMHDQAIEARTRLQLERATEQQAQDLENFKLDSQMLRAGKRRGEQAAEVAHELELGQTKQEAELRAQEARRAFRREQERLDAETRDDLLARQHERRRGHLSALRELGVDLTAYLTQARADRVIELRGSNGATHVHLDPARAEDRPGASPP